MVGPDVIRAWGSEYHIAQVELSAVIVGITAFEGRMWLPMRSAVRRPTRRLASLCWCDIIAMNGTRFGLGHRLCLLPPNLRHASPSGCKAMFAVSR